MVASRAESRSISSVSRSVDADAREAVTSAKLASSVLIKRRRRGVIQGVVFTLSKARFLLVLLKQFQCIPGLERRSRFKAGSLQAHIGLTSSQVRQAPICQRAGAHGLDDDSDHTGGATGLAFETGEITTMQAQTSTRTRNTATTPSLACLLSATSTLPPRSTGKERDYFRAVLRVFDRTVPLARFRRRDADFQPARLA